MKVVLIPWYLNESRNDNSERLIPLGLMSISAYLKKNGHSITIKDLNLKKYSDTNEMVNELMDLQADVYGFSAAAGTLHTALTIAERIKETDASKIIIFGGPHPTLVYKEMLAQFKFIDFIIRGEGEITFKELLEALENHCDIDSIKGITYRKNGEIVVTEGRPLIVDLDSIDMPDYEAYSLDRLNTGSVPVEIGRGCPFSCSYCASSVLWQRDYRVKSISRIVNEIKYLADKYGLKMYYFRHDQIILNRKWLIQLCEAIREKLPDIKWQCSARIDTIDLGLLEIMENSGCTGIEFGIESFSEKIQDSIGKNLKQETIYNNIKLVIDSNISPVLFFMCGFPEENERDLEHTLNSLLKLLAMCRTSTFFQLRVLQPFPNTKVKETHNDRLVFCKERLSKHIFSTYSKEQIAIASKDYNLFPEFYYIENDYGISIDFLLKIERIYNIIIRFLNSHFFLTLKYISFSINYEYKRLFEMIGNVINIDNIGNISENELINGLGELIKTFSNAEWLRDIFDYEKAIYFVSENYVKNGTSSNISNDTMLRINPNFKIYRFACNVNVIIALLKENSFEQLKRSFSEEGSIIAVYAVAKDNVLTIKLDKAFVEFINIFEVPKRFGDFIDNKALLEPIQKFIDRGVLIQ